MCTVASVLDSSKSVKIKTILDFTNILEHAVKAALRALFLRAEPRLHLLSAKTGSTTLPLPPPPPPPSSTPKAASKTIRFPPVSAIHFHLLDELQEFTVYFHSFSLFTSIINELPEEKREEKRPF